MVTLKRFCYKLWIANFAILPIFFLICHDLPIFSHLVGQLDNMGLQLLASVIVEGPLLIEDHGNESNLLPNCYRLKIMSTCFFWRCSYLVHEVDHLDLVALHIEVAQCCLLCLELARPVALDKINLRNYLTGVRNLFHLFQHAKKWEWPWNRRRWEWLRGSSSQRSRQEPSLWD